MEALFDRTRSFRFNCKKHYQKLKIRFCIKSVRDTKKISGEKILRFKKICKWAPGYFFYMSYIFCLLLKNIIKNKKNFFLSKSLRGIRKNFGDKFSKLYLNDRIPSAKREIYVFRSAIAPNARPRRAQICIFDANVALMDIK